MKLKKTLVARLEEQAQNAARMQIARKTAPMLIRLVGIHPHGIDLVIWLAGPASRDNLEATIHWIVAQLNDPTFRNSDRPTSVLDELVRRMTRQLAKVEGSYTCH